MPKGSPDRVLSRALNLELVAVLVEQVDLASHGLVHADAGQRLVSTGEVMTRLPLLEAGSIDAVLHQAAEEGSPVIPVSWQGGELVFLSQLFSRQPSQVDLVAAERVSLRWIPIDEIERVLLGNKALLVLVVQFLAQRLREVQRRERAWLERSVHERVHAYLSRIVRNAVMPADGPLVIAATHERLASRCGISRPRLSQELKRLEQAGRLRLLRGSIEITDRAFFAG